jgi:hypothetical protein
MEHRELRCYPSELPVMDSLRVGQGTNHTTCKRYIIVRHVIVKVLVCNRYVFNH